MTRLKVIRILCVIVHTLIFGFCLFKASTDYYAGPLFWLTMVALDFPVSWALTLPVFFWEGSKFVNEVVIPGLFFGVIGSVWWWYLPYWVYTLFSCGWNLLSRPSNGPSGHGHD